MSGSRTTGSPARSRPPSPTWWRRARSASSTCCSSPRTTDGTVASFEINELDDDVFGAYTPSWTRSHNLIGEEDIEDFAEDLEPGSSIALLVVEHVWAKSFADAVANSGGVVARLHAHPARRGRRAHRLTGAHPRRSNRKGHDMLRRRGGLVRAAATTAVVAGTAGAVRHHQENKYAAKDQAAYEEQMAEQQAQQPQVVYAEAPAPAAGGDDLAAQIQNLANLKAQGVLSEDEFAAAKAKLISG